MWLSTLRTSPAYNQARVEGQAIAEAPILAEDSEVEQRCSACGLILPEGTQVCPACMNKRRVLAPAGQLPAAILEADGGSCA